MIREERFLAFRRKFSDPILSGLTVFLALLLFALVPLQATIGFDFMPLGVVVVVVMVAGIYVLSASAAVLVPIARRGRPALPADAVS